MEFQNTREFAQQLDAKDKLAADAVAAAAVAAAEFPRMRI